MSTNRISRRKALTDMTLEELWALFPIVLTPHRAEWSDWAQAETALLSDLFSDCCPAISHIGSTAIPAIKAKPIIDILVEIPANKIGQAVKDMMETNGYLCMSESAGRMSFNKGYTPDGYAEKVFHIHVRAFGDNPEIAFRNYLIRNTATAYEYERLKLSLLPRYRHDRDGYTNAKSEFINKIMLLTKTFTCLFIAIVSFFA